MGTLLRQLNPATRAITLACRQTRSTTDQEAMSAALAQVDDWRAFSEHVERHRVSSIAGPVLAELPTNVIPTKTTRALSTRAKLQALKAQHLTDELLRMSQLCAAKNIDTLHYKGATTAIELYGGLHGRPFGDLDFLVRRDQIESVVALFEDEGYASQLPTSMRARSLHYRYRKEVGLRRKGFVFEPHFAFAPSSQSFDPGFDRLLERSTLLAISGESGDAELHTPHPEDAALIYAVAGAILEWRRLPKILDFARAAQRLSDADDGQAAWLRVHTAAADAGWERALNVSVLLASDLCAVDFPSVIRDKAAADRTAGKLTRRVVDLLNNPIQQRRFLPRHHRVFKTLHWHSRERLSDRLRYLVVTTTVPDHALVQRFPLPEWLTPVYHLMAFTSDYILHPLARGLLLLLRPALPQKSK